MTTTESRAKIINRYEGALLGVAVGDALGAPLEFMSAEQIKQTHAGDVTEMIGGGWLSVEPGEVTDDTQMTLAVAEGIAEGSNNEDRYGYIGENFLRWFDTHPKDVGNTCASVLGRARDLVLQEAWEAVAAAVYQQTNGRTAGNGALMRTVYPALFYENIVAAENAAVNIGRMTHYHPDSDGTIQAYTEAIHIIANSPEIGIDEAKKIATTARAVIEYVKRKNRGTSVAVAEPTGWAVDSLLCAFDAIDKTDSFEAALIYAVNLGGDADTIGAITGGLAGAIYGASAIPERWTEKLNNRPNEKTVRLFKPGYKEEKPEAMPDGYRPNILALRMAELAVIAYQNSH